jgi:sarcosine oxidase
MGCFACLELARLKVSVIGFDPADPPHDRASHTGESRVFRVAYAEHPDYVPLARRSGELWDNFGAEFGTPLLHRTGMLTIGVPGEALLTGLQESARVHGLALEKLNAAETHEHFPAFHLQDDQMAFLERAAGWVDVNASIRLALRAAENAGATLRRHCRVSGFRRAGTGFVLDTAQGSCYADRVILAAGAGSGPLLAGLKLPLTIQRKVLAWFEPSRPELFREARFPVFAAAPSFFYGFPNIAGHGVKLAIHWSDAEIVKDAASPVRPAAPEDWLPVLEAASRLLPGLAGPWPGDRGRFLRAKTCLYTMTPDQHFLIDRHPELENVYFAAGFSGHGFKFATAVGEALAQLAIEGRPRLPIEFLRLAGRFPGRD